MDIGNSRIKWSCQSGHGLENQHAAFYSKTAVRDCLDAEWGALRKPARILVSNVAGESVAEQVTGWSTVHWQIEPWFATVTRTAGGVINAYPDADQLGIDRWLALLATWKKYARAACIVDCGTAITIDGVNGEGRHLGGLIVPGSVMMQRSLYENAPGIQVPGALQPVEALADNTGQGVVSGCTMAVVAFIDRMVTRLEKELGEPLLCVITGGAAGSIAPLLQSVFVHEPQLVLEGLALAGGDQT